MKLQSDFAILDVKRGRGLLNRRLKHTNQQVVIIGKIVGVWGSDDNVSQEFVVEVERVVAQ